MSDQGNTGAQDGSTDQGEAPDEFALALQERAASDREPPADAAGVAVDDPALQDKLDTQPGSDLEAGQNNHAAGNVPPADATPPDIWRDAPPQYREAFKAAERDAEYRLSSVRGRVSALDRQLAQLKSGKGEQQEQAAVTDKPSDKPADDEMTGVMEEYPEIVGPLVKHNKMLADRLDALEAPVQRLSQTQADAVTGEQMGVLEKAHPDWRTYTADDRYPGWLEKQPAAFREAGRRAVNLEDGAEAAWLLGEFKKAIGAEAPPAQTDQQDSQRNMGQRRERQLQAGRDGGRSSAPGTSGVPDDFDAAVGHISQQRERARQRPFA